MSYVRHSHCSYCGRPFDPGQPWPRTCAHCGNVTFLNPTPVTVVLVPVDTGLLAVRRSIEPARGQLALPGGYVNLGETWQAAGAREVWEETGLRLEPDELSVFAVHSTPPPSHSVLIFSLARPRTAADLADFAPNEEVSEWVVLTGPQPLAFSLHTQVAGEYFRRRTNG